MTGFQQRVAKKTKMGLLVTLLGLGGGFWITTEAIAPQTAHTKPARVHISLERQPNESYESLVERAEAAALTGVQQSFGEDMGVTDVAIVIVGQNQGAIAPVLSLQVSRVQWRSDPDAQRWATYFNNAKSLLGLEEEVTSTPGQPRAATPASARQPTNSTPGQPGTFNRGISGQIVSPGTSFSPQQPLGTPIAPSNTQNQTLQNSSTTNSPSLSTPANAQQRLLTPQPSSGTSFNNPVNNSSGNIPNSNPLGTPTQNQIPNGTAPGTTLPNTPGNPNIIIPGTTQKQNSTTNDTYR